ncbi:hypothetical protein OAF45_03340, partial [Candidatus Latescibacteria bacterium]|nr:hypothetical protein [Candidatus Latescibacterota bacterium]
ADIRSSIEQLADKGVCRAFGAALAEGPGGAAADSWTSVGKRLYQLLDRQRVTGASKGLGGLLFRD